jgi:AhpD family alkylhydroperoxidase
MSLYDFSHLKRIGVLGQLAPESMAGFKVLDDAALAAGAIPKKYKELMAIAVALTTQCPYCIEVHRKAARAGGATDAELAETVFVAGALRAGAAVTHGTHLFPG